MPTLQNIHSALHVHRASQAGTRTTELEKHFNLEPYLDLYKQDDSKNGFARRRQKYGGSYLVVSLEDIIARNVCRCMSAGVGKGLFAKGGWINWLAWIAMVCYGMCLHDRDLLGVLICDIAAMCLGCLNSKSGFLNLYTVEMNMVEKIVVKVGYFSESQRLLYPA